MTQEDIVLNYYRLKEQNKAFREAMETALAELVDATPNEHVIKARRALENILKED